MNRGDLPSVTFVDPALHYDPNDDHPPVDMMKGQHLVKKVYNGLRNGLNTWDKTLFVVTYDEHGGLYDHVAPPVAEILEDPQRALDRETVAMARARTSSSASSDGPVAPGRRGVAVSSGRNALSSVILDGILEVGLPDSTTDRYKPEVTTLYGIRVPTFMASQYIPQGALHHDTWDFCSILKTILERFCPENKPFMSDRVSASEHFGKVLTLTQPRTDNPSMPDLPPLPGGRRRPPVNRFFSKAALTRDDADWHDFMQVLGRIVPAPKRTI